MSSFVRDLVLSGGKILIFIGSLATLLLAVGYLIFPELLKASGKVLDQMFDVEGWMMKNKQWAGAIFLVITVILFLALALIR